LPPWTPTDAHVTAAVPGSTSTDLVRTRPWRAAATGGTDIGAPSKMAVAAFHSMRKRAGSPLARAGPVRRLNETAGRCAVSQAGGRSCGVRPRVGPVGVLQIEPAQERLPAQVDVLARQASSRRPQPDRQGIVTAGQAVNLQTDQSALDKREFAGVVNARRAGGQPRVNPVPGHHRGSAVAVGALHGFRVGLAPGVGLGEAELLAVLRRAAALLRRDP
jgi:hypothetical protein